MRKFLEKSSHDAVITVFILAQKGKMAFKMPFVPRELSKSDYFSNIVNFPFILTGIDFLLPNRFFFFRVISPRIPVRLIDKCTIAATIEPSMRKIDKMTLRGARVIKSQTVYQIILKPIAKIEMPDMTEIFIFSDFVIS